MLRSLKRILIGREDQQRNVMFWKKIKYWRISEYITCIGFSSFYADLIDKETRSWEDTFQIDSPRRFVRLNFNKMKCIHAVMRANRRDVLLWSNSCHSQHRWVFVGRNERAWGARDASKRPRSQGLSSSYPLVRDPGNEVSCDVERRREIKGLFRRSFSQLRYNPTHSAPHRKRRQLHWIEAALRGNPRRFQETAATICEKAGHH